jgi:hypothetical protein
MNLSYVVSDWNCDEKLYLDDRQQMRCSRDIAHIYILSGNGTLMINESSPTSLELGLSRTKLTQINPAMINELNSFQYI